MDGRMFDGIGKALLGCAVAIAAVGAAVGFGGAKVSEAFKDEDTTVGVRLTEEQQILRKNGALCDAYLTQAFADAMRQPEGRQVVTLKLPKNAAQNCPKA